MFEILRFYRAAKPASRTLSFSNRQVWANSVDPDQTAPVWSGSTRFVILSALFRCITLWKSILVKGLRAWRAKNGPLWNWFIFSYFVAYPMLITNLEKANRNNFVTSVSTVNMDAKISSQQCLREWNKMCILHAFMILVCSNSISNVSPSLF